MLTRSNRLIIIVAAVALTVDAPSAAAQEAPAPAVQASDVASLSRLLDQQRTLLETQGRLIDELTKRLDETSKTVAASQQRISDLEQRAAGTPPQVQQRLAEIEQSLRTLPELTAEGTGHGRLPRLVQDPRLGCRDQIRRSGANGAGAQPRCAGHGGSIRHVLHSDCGHDRTLQRTRA